MADSALFSKVGLQPKNRNVQKQPRPAYKISKGTLYGTLVDQTPSQNLIHFVDFAEFDKKNVLTIHYHRSLNAKGITKEIIITCLDLLEEQQRRNYIQVKRKSQVPWRGSTI